MTDVDHTRQVDYTNTTDSSNRASTTNTTTTAAVPASLVSKPMRLWEALYACGAQENELISIVFPRESMPLAQASARNRAEVAQYGTGEPFVCRWRWARNGRRNLIELRPMATVFPSKLLYDADTVVDNVYSLQAKQLGRELRRIKAQPRDIVKLQLEYATPCNAVSGRGGKAGDHSEVLTLKQQRFTAEVVDIQDDWVTLHVQGQNKTVCLAAITPVAFAAMKRSYFMSPAGTFFTFLLHLLTLLTCLAAVIVMFHREDDPIASDDTKFAIATISGIVTAFLYMVALALRNSRRGRGLPLLVNDAVMAFGVLTAGMLIYCFIDACGWLSYTPDGARLAWWILLLIASILHPVSTALHNMYVRQSRGKAFDEGEAGVNAPNSNAGQSGHQTDSLAPQRRMTSPTNQDASNMALISRPAQQPNAFSAARPADASTVA